MNRISWVKKSFIGLLLITFVWVSIVDTLLFYYRPEIPFGVVSPYIAWRSVDDELAYRKVNKTKFEHSIEKNLQTTSYVQKKNDYS